MIIFWNTDKNCILIGNFNFIFKFWGLLEIKVFWNKSYKAILFVHHCINKTFSHELYLFVNESIWQKFDNHNFSMREAIMLQIFKAFMRNKKISNGLLWVKINHLVLILGTALTFDSHVVKELELKVRTSWRIIPTFEEVTGEKLIGFFASNFCLQTIKLSWIFQVLDLIFGYAPEAYSYAINNSWLRKWKVFNRSVTNMKIDVFCHQ